MARSRSVGKQAASDEDLVQLSVLRAYINALPGQYLELSRLNQPNGVPQLDANSRMGNTYLPTDISRTNLTASTKVTTATLQATGAATVDSLGVAKGATVGTTLAVTGAATAASLDVGTGNVKAGTITAPENTATTFKAKATTLDSLAVSGASSHGATTVASLTSGGDIVGNGTTGRLQVPGDVIAGTDVRGRDFYASRNLQVGGSSFLQDTNVAGNLKGVNADGTAKTLPVLGDMNVGGAFRAAGITTPGNVVADLIVQGSQGLQTPGTLDVIGAANVGSLGSSGDIVGQNVVQAIGQLKGGSLAVTGAGTVGGTLGVTGKITAGDINSPTALFTGQVHIASSSAATASQYLIAGKFLRQNADRSEVFASAGKWLPNFAGAHMTVKANAGSAGGSGQDIPNGQMVTVQLPTVYSSDISSGTIFQSFNQGIRVLVPGLYQFTGVVTTAMLGQRGGQVIGLGVNNGTWVSDSTMQTRTGGEIDTWSQNTIQTVWTRRLSANDYINVKYFATNSGFQTDIVSESDTIYMTRLTGVFLGN